MTDRFRQRMVDAGVRKDTRLLGDFAVIYCRGRHRDAERRALVSDAALLGVYGRKVPMVCDGCADLLRYAEQRRALCPKDPKPFCSHCDTHCYRPELAERMREVMRYAGPRSVLHGHVVGGVRHLVDGRRARRAAEAARAASKHADRKPSVRHDEGA
jgi:hypothetical protein